MQALAQDAQASTAEAVAATRQSRDQLSLALQGVRGVQRVYPSKANFLLVRFDDADMALRHLQAAGVVVRDMRALPQLGDALRITVGTPAQNARVLAALGGRDNLGASA